MFIGEYTISMDAKGRIAVPAKFRSKLSAAAVVTRGLDRSLFLYTKSEWEAIATKLAALPLSKANSRAFARLMLAGAYDAELDKQGRMMIPEYLRKFASLGKKVVVAGLYNRIEIWDSQTWEAYKKTTESESTSIAEALGELGV
ncbi:MAG: cell division/cell wall cluster transcriptional repressor MraZ [Candidatus Doudnabacteria bacterium RIFCSPLOWO2_02_FULL_42_9]|uniref:Transcriptional regulator MraZ n=1 Tax=Candidatus Doudnabacteria bacterium RIFCSPHIGHO2_01_FULL_41_86 TaxID=1817821 RepID=A0A1F5N7Y2_9BACT|nr:MAG: cell division/cell wall cluster transcriptional repressor MraZ [Candidatus Doudnabacteria bacterium RIFCSPHIGHO2_01_FULL_41_86]OGE74762.1 MAG: cell division/cell wall cluster transcriptional repressor MraZ [Candidatus Doudnabacteria bacterium RIFCSPHIGHO2_01_43_10]OGE85729.1 MAG: cell division/cell wall cluster transcriptional repressor MraZ [Candidatus Doudnabacteria bacterium RIFCSPHIGHO2_12_FULL_42_22]OGE87225.1 MAG: cell division/cell wall cluster transcriptional repressor MraZ [Cand